jgi:hypothetical protein
MVLMKITPGHVDVLVWSLIYVGLLVLCLGLFVQRQGGAFGGALLVVGGVAAAVGALLVWVRSRMKG